MRIRIEKLRGPVSLQDGGRPGQAQWGVPRGGFADGRSAKMANRLVENLDNAPLLECTLGCPDIHFEENCVLAWTGAIGSFNLNGEPMPMNRRVQLSKGSELKGSVFTRGLRGYLAIAGRWKIEKWRGSVSPLQVGDKFLPTKSVLKNGNELEIEQRLPKGNCYSKNEDLFSANNIITMHRAPEFDVLTIGFGRLLTFQQTLWKVDATSSRMGIRLMGEGLLESPVNATMRSVPVLPGTVQLLPTGNLIVSHVDGQTIGGYPRIGWVDDDALDVLAQAVPGKTKIRFEV